MYTKMDMKELTQGAKGYSVKEREDGSKHVTAYTDRNRVSYDEDKNGKITNLHTSNNSNRSHHIDIEVR